ncbi:MAG: ParB/RepB/Spo0J family partition protein [Pseudomonadota bacterium]
MAAKKKGLGRGLSALMDDAGLSPVDATTDDVKPPLETKSLKETKDEKASSSTSSVSADETAGVQTVAISRLIRNRAQPRKHFDTGALDDLIASVQQKGILQPILVRKINNPETRGREDYQIVAGERRYRAALKAGLTSVPVLVRDLSDRDILEIGVIENVQRADLNPLEEALAYEKLINEFGRSQAEIATSIGKSRVHVANTVRLTGLTERGRELLLRNEITAGHARTLLAAKDPDALAEAIVKNKWSVREAERWVNSEKNPPKSKSLKLEKSTDIKALEQKIRDTIGYPADIRHTGRGGEIRLKYKDLDHMEALLSRLGLMHR